MYYLKLLLVSIEVYLTLLASCNAALDWSEREFSSILSGTENLKCHVEYAHDIPVEVEHEIRSYNHRQPDACCDLCLAEPECRGFAWNADLNGTCWLKETSGPLVAIPKLVMAGYVIARKSQSLKKDAAFEKKYCTALPNVTLHGEGTTGKKVGEYSSSCCERCTDDKKCTAYTWQDGNCLLHTGTFEQLATPGVHSGILRHRPQPPSSYMWLLQVMAAVIFIAMLVGLLYSCKLLRKEKRIRLRLLTLEHSLKTKGDLNRLDHTIALSEQAELLEFKEQFEFPRTRLRFLEIVLGSGKYGQVVLGEARGILKFTMTAAEAAEAKQGRQASLTTSLHQRWSKVAVKLVRDQGNEVQLRMLMAELKVHMHVGHHLNVVNLLAAVTKNFQFGEMFVLLEYCLYGSLKSFLVKHRSDMNFLNQVTADGQLMQLDQNLLEAKQRRLEDGVNAAVAAPPQTNNAEKSTVVEGPLLTSNDLVSFAYQLASGMAFLAEKLVIHRDLAARNVLVTDNLVVKICDFGLAREGSRDEQDGAAEYSRSPLKYYNDEPLPVKWVAPECVSEIRFSTASDVWSYGITLWEIFSLGGDPYPGDKPSGEFFARIFSGYRMPRPVLAPQQMYTIMQLCWDIEPRQRPTFIQLQELVSSMTNNDELVKYQALYAQEPYQYMHLISERSNTRMSNEEASPLYPPNTTAKHRVSAAKVLQVGSVENQPLSAVAQRLIEQTPQNSTDEYLVYNGDGVGVGERRQDGTIATSQSVRLPQPSPTFKTAAWTNPEYNVLHNGSSPKNLRTIADGTGVKEGDIEMQCLVEGGRASGKPLLPVDEVAE